MERLFRAVRESCSAATWSRGVELSRAEAVVGIRASDDEIELRVNTQATISPTVYLYPGDEDWSCECNHPEDACPHVAGAVIALRQARQRGESLPGAGSSAPGRLGYRLGQRDRWLSLDRVVVTTDGEAPLVGTLTANTSGNAPSVTATQQDVQIEAVLASYGDGPLPRGLLPKLFKVLADAPDLTFKGEPIAVAGETSGLCLRVQDCAVGVRVLLEQAPEVDEVLENGAVRSGRTLRALGKTGLSERLFAELKAGKIFAPNELGDLAGDLLPRIERHLAIIVETDRLPGRVRLKPRLRIGSERIGDEVEVIGQLVYGDPPVARVDGERLTLLGDSDAPVRNPRLEQRLLRRLRHELGLEPGVKRRLTAAEGIALNERLRGATIDRPTGDALGGFFETATLAPALDRGEGQAFEIWFEPEEERFTGGRPGAGGRADPAAVLAAWEHNEDLVPLLGGGFARLPLDWLARHGHRLRDLLEANDGASSTPAGGLAPWAAADLAALCEALNQPPPPELDGLRQLLQNDTDEAGESTPLPEDLRATLRDYQRDGVGWLSRLRKARLGALLADDMGLGKTVQALCVLGTNSLVVAPRSVLDNWAEETARFRPGLRINLFHGPGRTLDPTADVTLTTYAILRLDAETLAARQWSTVVLDEAQAIKNPSSQVARAAFALRAESRLALTGTPVENRLEDLWSQMHFLNRGLLAGRQAFRERFAEPIRAGDRGAAERLRARIRPFLLRRLKREVATELPPRTEVVLRCDLSDPERAAYDTVRAATRTDLLAKLDSGANTLAILEALLRLRQAACHPALLPGHGDAAREPSAKLRLLLETLDAAVASGHKALIFSQWTSLLDLIEPTLRGAAIDFCRLDGSTRDRGAVVARFQDPAGPPVMLISLKAGGTGLNLTAADYVFLVDPWWNPAVEDQAAARAHRIGQDKPVIVHRLVARDTVEERILALQESKRELAEAALGEAGSARAVTREELLALLQ